MARPEKYAVDEVAEALRASLGIVTGAARALGCDPETVRRYVKRYPDELAGVLTEAREQLKDLAEGKLLKAIRGENMTAIIFFLKTQARDRGYSQSHSVEVSGNLAVTTGAEGVAPEKIESALAGMLGKANREPEPQG